MAIRVQPLLRAACVAATAALAAWAGDISGPVAGYFFDAPSRSVRPVLGIPGASTIGQPLDLGFDAAVAAVAPAQDFLLAGGSDGRARLIRLSGGFAAEAFDALHGAPERIVFSPRGAAAVLVNAGTLDVYTGLPGSPALARTLAVTASPAALAVSDDGEAVLAVFDGVLSVAGAAAEWKTLASAGKAALAAFAPASRDAAVVSAAGSVTLYSAVTDGGGTAVLTAPDRLVDTPVGVAFLAAGKVLVASGSARTVTILDTGGTAPASIPCGCSPTGLTAMGTLFRLNELADAPLWLLDAGADEPRLLFVPALQAPLAAPATP